MRLLLVLQRCGCAKGRGYHHLLLLEVGLMWCCWGGRDTFRSSSRIKCSCFFLRRTAWMKVLAFGWPIDYTSFCFPPWCANPAWLSSPFDSDSQWGAAWWGRPAWPYKQTWPHACSWESWDWRTAWGKLYLHAHDLIHMQIIIALQIFFVYDSICDGDLPIHYSLL